LDFPDIGRNGDTLDSLLDESSGNLSFGFTDICLTEEELPVQIRDINGICWYEHLVLAEIGSTYPYR
jgi:hypothetical protein